MKSIKIHSDSKHEFFSDRLLIIKNTFKPFSRQVKFLTVKRSRCQLVNLGGGSGGFSVELPAATAGVLS